MTRKLMSVVIAATVVIAVVLFVVLVNKKPVPKKLDSQSASSFIKGNGTGTPRFLTAEEYIKKIPKGCVIAGEGGEPVGYLPTTGDQPGDNVVIYWCPPSSPKIYECSNGNCNQEGTAK